jgi:4-amino-4-deoxy-L-arabinose transferase-like glycosyltransferase
VISRENSVLSDLNPGYPLLWILLGALLIRIVSVQPLHSDGYTSDEQEYIFLGQQLSLGEPFIDSNGERSTRSPLFPLMLAGLFTVGGVGLSLAHGLGVVLGTLTVLMGYALSVRLFRDRRAGIVTAIGLAFYPGLVIYSALLQTESLYLVLFLGVFLLGLQLVDAPGITGGILLGFLAGLATLTRAVFLGFFPFLLLLLAGLAKDRGVPIRGSLTSAAIAFAVVLLPWTIRNYEIHGDLVPVSSWGGKSLLIGNNPYATGTWSTLPGFEEWLDQKLVEGGHEVAKSMGEVPLSHVCADIAVDYIRESPGEWAALVLKKAHMFLVYPITNSDRDIPLQMVAVLADIPVLVVASIGLVAMWGLRRKLTPFLGAIFFFSLVHVLLHVEARYRLPLIPFLMLFFGPGLVLVGKGGGLSSHLPTRAMRYSVVVIFLMIMGVYTYTGLMFLRGNI